MRLHYLMHHKVENIGSIKEWAEAKGYKVTGSKTFLAEPLPNVEDIDFLVIMGGPQSLRHIEQYPYLLKEVAFIKKAIELNKIVLGFCLGAQLIGEALGAPTRQSPEKEIGLFPIELTQEGQQDPLFSMLPPKLDVVHWHGDMPGLPEGAQVLATSAGCPCQAFRVSERVYGFQFHMEILNASIEKMTRVFKHELGEGKYIQSISELSEIDTQPMNKKLTELLERLSHLHIEERIAS